MMTYEHHKIDEDVTTFTQIYINLQNHTDLTWRFFVLPLNLIVGTGRFNGCREIRAV